MAYQFESRVRYSEVGADQKLTVANLIDYFQDSSTFHSLSLGRGVDYQLKQNKVWMILSWQVEIFRLPSLGEKIISKTWPTRFRAFYGYRDFALMTEAGEYLAKAHSIWAWIDLATGHPAKVEEQDLAGYELEPPLTMVEFPRKIHVPEGLTQMEQLTVSLPMLDTNQHMNNGQFIAVAQRHLPEGFLPKVVWAEYRNQAKLHDIMIPRVLVEDHKVVVDLCNQDGKTYAAVVFYDKAPA